MNLRSMFRIILLILIALTILKFVGRVANNIKPGETIILKEYDERNKIIENYLNE